MEVEEAKESRGIASELLRFFKERKWIAAVKQGAMPAAYLISGIMSAPVSVIGGALPFGVALICSANGFINASAALAGAALGSAALGNYGMWQILVLLFSFLSRLTMSFAAHLKKTKEEALKSFSVKQTFRDGLRVKLYISVICAVIMGVINIVYSTNIYSDIFSTVIGLALFPAFTYAFYLVASKKEKQSLRIAGLCGAGYAASLLLQDAGFPFNAGVIFALGATLYVTFSNGMLSGAALGAFCGMALQPEYAPLYPLAAFTSGTVVNYSSVAAVIAASSAGLCWAVRVGGFSGVSDVFPEIIFTCAVGTALVNMGIFPKRELFLEAKTERPDEMRGDYIFGRFSRLSESLDSISKLLFKVSDKVQRPTSEEAQRICDTVKDKYCANCVNNASCGGGDEKAFFSKLFDSLQERGNVTAAIVPPRLAARCYNMEGILSYSNTSAAISGKLAAESCKTRLFASDYKAVASLLRETVAPDDTRWERDRSCEVELRERFAGMGVEFAGISVYGKRNRTVYLRGMSIPNPAGENDIREMTESVVGGRLSSPDFTIDGSNISVSMRSVPRLKIEVGRYSSAGVKDNFSGDTVSSFENGDGYYYSLVSDGMGSGREAALTSGLSSVFLENLLSSGAPLKPSLELLNSFICGGEGECFTTVDLMETDLFTGKTSFIKSGAAPSFVIRGGKVFRLHSKTVPIGIIRVLDSEVISFDAMEGDQIIMMSDGVTGSYEACPWLYEMLEGEAVRGLTPVLAARMIGEAAEKETGRSDDITVAVMKVMSA
ncbi:MAG: SpoIIE family protein phosphatase [Clostridia bacterium]|nr:SpoIIE family protein phosphatase [Clostridia bacterium]